MARTTEAKTSKKSTEYKTCIKCNKEKTLKYKFYSTVSDLYPDKKYPVCKDCIVARLPPANPDSLEYIEKVRSILADLNKPFLTQIWLVSIEESNETKKDLFGIYMKNLALNSKDLTFKDSDHTSLSQSTEFDDVPISESVSDETDFKNDDIELTPEDMQSQKDTVRLLGYDPFAGYSKLDRKFLYAELIPYLDEDTLEDQYKISIIIQILNNNNQIRKIDLLINNLSSDEKKFLSNSGDIKQIIESNDKLSKENAIAIKHRGDKKAGRSTLGYLMKDLRELGFENAEEDYYDMKKAYGMQITADISNKSILSQLNFDEKDLEDMLKEQRDLLLNYQDKIMELEEKLRLANEQILELKKNGSDSQ
ncbi:hypothetical protein BRE01_62250 [Brevibacillus reuszeri]|uniref:Uncharacterized protein n=1 Tax=Brevibacillus reuszeri TaxID=54915 RepID=A0A0K9YWC4_9BACL|nr:hypothetical protein [Brevibacillus reuszeri]KNB72922.1 hypothetical protein ADS79_13935 [Brevibacillus reuszeri]GED72523.1 hypothetical protein BRE01_62250 [Brevibacillus reuszeri]